jgi:NAD(P)-dependent dehydrogenase (short-subunit alcohol dehydrogenase family)
MTELEGKVAVVTGAGSGIGRAGAQLFAEEGARVVVADLRHVQGQAVADEIVETGGEAIAIEVDVRDRESVASLVSSTVERYGRIDALFHNAMDVALVNEHDRAAIDLDESTWDAIIGLVLTGTFLCTKYVGRQMREQGSGSIVLTATVDALIAQPGFDAYTAAKGGVVAMTRSVAAALAPHRVRVNAIAPGFVDTEPQQAWLEQPGKREAIERLHLLGIAQPRDIAQAALFLASDRSRMMTGGVYPVDGGYTAFKGGVDIAAAVQGDADG